MKDVAASVRARLTNVRVWSRLNVEGHEGEHRTIVPPPSKPVESGRTANVRSPTSLQAEEENSCLNAAVQNEVRIKT